LGKTGELMFVVVYWWRAKPGKEEQFREAWRRGTLAINLAYGSLGSRLHREEDGRFIGVAEWPDHATWKRAFDARMVYDDEETRRLFNDAIAESPPDGMPLLTMDATDDLLDRTGGLSAAFAARDG
jgi:heme-degrading monooxygenase HmoA